MKRWRRRPKQWFEVLALKIKPELKKRNAGIETLENTEESELAQKTNHVRYFFFFFFQLSLLMQRWSRVQTFFSTDWMAIECSHFTSSSIDSYLSWVKKIHCSFAYFTSIWLQTHRSVSKCFVYRKWEQSPKFPGWKQLESLEENKKALCRISPKFLCWWTKPSEHT